ncbi:hypothetical protein DUI87_26396 [Hirundo rustica rustica]|uniref:tRNA-uridine aminocarboxypropyltransferase n=1 Tax=Hirundo rustica rustica TaxID=333673 RepID=A0A3M0J8B8_HIRRU|nr:hypothetical protein DUI87_26396 [Hirundo rustica rustica]
MGCPPQAEVAVPEKPQRRDPGSPKIQQDSEETPNSWILQQMESRVLRTVPLLAACLPPDKCKILVGRRFNEDRYPELATVCRNSNTLILYPGADATNLEEVAMMSSSPSVMIIIDGTWSQAKDIFYKNSLFRLPKQFVPITPCRVPTVPDEECLSSSPAGPFRSCKIAMRSPHNLSFSRQNGPNSPSLAL